MAELVAPVLTALDTETAIAAAQTIFKDARIEWRVINYSAGNGRMDLVGMAVESENKVIVSANSRSATAYYKDRTGLTILESRGLGSVGAACADLKSLIDSNNRVFAN